MTDCLALLYSVQSCKTGMVKKYDSFNAIFNMTLCFYVKLSIQTFSSLISCHGDFLLSKHHFIFYFYIFINIFEEKMFLNIIM